MPVTITDRWTVAGALATTVGAAALLAPTALVRAYGLHPSAGSGGSALGWRLFGVRTAVIGAAVLRDDPSARASVLPVQLADQLVFGHALLTGAVPRRTALAAMATSAALIALSRPEG